MGHTLLCDSRLRMGGHAGRRTVSLALVLALLGFADAALAKKNKKAEQAAAAAVAVDGPKQPPSEAPPAERGDEFGGATTSREAFSLRMLLQTRYRVTAPEQGDLSGLIYEQVRSDERENDGLRVQRAYLRVTATPTPTLTAKLTADFAELLYNNEDNTLKRASVELTPTKALRLEAGFFKIPFSLLELISTAELEYADDGPLDDLIKDLGIAGRDVGVMLSVAPLERPRWLRLEVGAFNGNNEQAQPYSGPGLYAARISSRPLSELRLGADCAFRPRAVDVWNDETLRYQERFTSGSACSTDAQLALKPFAIRAEFITGRRTDSPVLAVQNSSLIGEDRNFMGVWGVASYRLKLRRKMALTPALRVEWMDEDRLDPAGENTFISATMTLDFSDSTRLLFDLTRSESQIGTVKRAELTPLPRTNSTIGTVQLQLVL